MAAVVVSIGARSSERDAVPSIPDRAEYVNRLREILSAQPDPASIERERAAIFALQEAQQRAVIAQLLKEREMLRSEQRAALAQLLLAQRAGVPTGR